MPLLGDIAMLFIHFHTLLIIFGLTYQLSAPQCQFLFSAVFVFQVFPLRELPEKSRKNYIKISVPEASWHPKYSRRGATRAPGALVARPPSWPRRGGRLGPPGLRRCPPLAYIYTASRNPRGRNPFSRSHLCSAAAALPRSGAPGELFPAPCRRGGSPPGASPPPWTPPG